MLIDIDSITADFIFTINLELYFSCYLVKDIYLAQCIFILKLYFLF